MLTFLAVAARKRFVVDRYDDEASGVLERNPLGKLAVTRVTLRPRVVFSGTRQPSAEERAAMHHLAHQECFIANSVHTEVTVAER
jgi:organic hydroperoxide reductase OsmC/OhrA